ncbi:MAG: hypothetical protein ABIP40_03960 [Bacteroidia bacterium]
MTKHLTELDTVYADVFKNMAIQERLDYCQSLINTTKSFLVKNNEFLQENIKEKSRELITAAENEMKELSTSDKKNKK